MLSRVGFNPFSQLKTENKNNSVKQFSPMSLKTLSRDTVSFKSDESIEQKKAEAPESIQRLHNYIGKLKSKIQGNILVISGPSGAGKDTVIDLMRKKNPKINSVVSLATRDPRPGEIDGVNYKFLKGKNKYKNFEKLIHENKLFQYMHSIDNGQYYGVTKKDLEQKRKGHDVIMNVTADEAMRIKRENKDKAVTMFVDASSPEELEARLRARGTENPEEIEKRIKSGIKQREFAPDFDKIIINAKGAQNEAAENMSDYIDERKDPILKSLEDVEQLLEEKYDFSNEKKQ
ncbi:MAG: hypothetical protein WCK67_13110 [bacterium]